MPLWAEVVAYSIVSIVMVFISVALREKAKQGIYARRTANASHQS